MFVTALALFLFLASQSWLVTADGAVRGLDERLSERVRQPVPVDDGPAELAADLGNLEVAVPVLAFAMALSLPRRGRTAPVLGRAPAALAMICVPLLVVPLKLLFDRPGPLGGGGHYPSGHAATAVVAYGAAVLLLWPHLRPRYVRWCAALLTVALVAATGVGLVVRVYHWPMDVTAGYALGGLLLLGAGWLSGRSRRFAPPRRASPVPESPGR